MPSCVALIPARGGSERVKNKNIRELGGKPLLAWTIESARDSGVFNKILVSSDDVTALEIGQSYGADVLKRPEQFATSVSPDIEWVSHALSILERQGEKADCFSILRPTSPFRTPKTIQRAWHEWMIQHPAATRYDSLRAVEKVLQHPGKMWYKRGRELVPFVMQPSGTPFHSQQYKALPEVYVQNASLEIAWWETVTEKGSIAGDRVMAFETDELEGFDINTEDDWATAEQVVDNL